MYTKKAFIILHYMVKKKNQKSFFLPKQQNSLLFLFLFKNIVPFSTFEFF
uniref:Uncharacterized protein n=1 Tax=Chlorella vulgaris TaxID=3077 RepID=V9H156_CHLVU|nr:hypothetical protein ChvulCp120 [Chlorella vulgaris]pir/T07307/ hypothetical protein 49d - Chlorella vulgaris chloroplast [Chlorella vulgaris]BAA57955.1 unnamed protein product [Chlorella vulgaris]